MRTLLLSMVILLCANLAFGQSVSINTSGNSPDPSAILDLEASDKGLLIPRMNSSDRTSIGTPANGLLVYDTDFASFWFYNGTAWAQVANGLLDELTDADSDTKIQVEKSPDEDVIRFEVAGTEQMSLQENANGDARLQLNFGNSNLLLGESAGQAVSGGFNSFFGQSAGAATTTGHSNVFSGYQAGIANVDGHSNLMIGRSAGLNNGSGANNVFLGRGAGLDNDDGDANVFISRNAGYSNTSGSNNLALGSSAGYSNATGSGNIFLGFEAGYNETGSNKLYVDNSNTPKPLIYGEFDNDLVQVNGSLNINDAYTLPTTDGSNGEMLSTNGAGALSWIAAASGSSSGSVEIRSVRDDAAMAALGYCYAGCLEPELTTDWFAIDSIGPNVPSARSNHVAFWTGSKMLIWGGRNGSTLYNDGALYDPVTNSWSAMSNTNAPSPRRNFSAVLAGDQLIIWGGSNSPAFYGDGKIYDLTTDTWSNISGLNAPSSRDYHAATWTGTEMIVWGGRGVANVEYNDGSRYNPATNTWTAISATGAPSVRFDHSAVWTGTEMIIWGGFTETTTEPIPNGGRYNLGTNTWSGMASVSAGAARNGHDAYWTDEKMIIWSGYDFDYYVQPSGTAYDLATNSWSSIGSGTIDDETQFASVWTGVELLTHGETVFGEEEFDAYNLSTNTWTALPSWHLNARTNHSLVWADGKMILWGGTDYGTGVSQSGAIFYRPKLFLYLHF